MADEIYVDATFLAEEIAAEEEHEAMYAPRTQAIPSGKCVSRVFSKIATDCNITYREWASFRVFASVFLILFTVDLVAWVVAFSIWDFLCLLGLTFYGLLPCYLSNAGMVITGKINGVKRYPIDRGKVWPKDGRRVLGEGKTWNGLLGGVFLGFFLTIALYPFTAWVANLATDSFILPNGDGSPTLMRFFDLQHILLFLNAGNNFALYVGRTFLLALGAPLGDMAGSFLKRRFGKSDGAQFLLLDQLDFILVSALLVWPLLPFPWYSILFICLLTPLLTVIANLVAYYLGKKPYPW